MFNVIIAFKNSERSWQFLFKDGETATEVISKYNEIANALSEDVTDTAAMRITDHFGSSALIPFELIGGILVEDMTKAVDAGVERGIFHLRGQAKTETKMRNDPALKLLAPMNGSAVQQRRPF
jgi:hypothetical protein